MFCGIGGGLKSGDTLVQNYLFTGEKAEKYFPKAGSYHFRFRRKPHYVGIASNDVEPILSNAVELKITEPEGIDLEAYTFLKSKLKVRTNSDPLQQELAKKQAFIDRFGESVYGDHYRVALADRYFWSGYEADAEREYLLLEKKDTIYKEHVSNQLQKLSLKNRRTTFAEHFKNRTQN